MSNFESGHAKNVANFTWLREEVEGFGLSYNPAPVDIRLAALLTRESELNNAMNGMASSLANLKDAVNDRQVVFEDLEKRCTRILGEAIACGADEKILADIRHLVRKIRGQRAKPIKEEEIPPAEPFSEGKAPESDPAPKVRRSASQRSYDYQKDHFVQIVALMGKIPGYASNEPDMTIAGMTNIGIQLGAATQNVFHTNAALEMSREQRDKLLYKYNGGAVYLARKVKGYVKATYGQNSTQYKAILQIVFKLYPYGGL